MKDIESLSDIQLLVNTFYERVKQNELLGPVFEEVVKGNWAPHLDKMYRFWQTILLDEHTYTGSPFAQHVKLPITAEHFQAWLTLFFATVDQLFSGIKAEEAKNRAAKMGEMFQYKLAYIRSQEND